MSVVLEDCDWVAIRGPGGVQMWHLFDVKKQEFGCGRIGRTQQETLSGWRTGDRLPPGWVCRSCEKMWRDTMGERGQTGQAYGGGGLPARWWEDEQPKVVRPTWEIQTARPQEPEQPSVVQGQRLAVVAEVPTRTGEPVLLAANGRVYRRQRGNVSALVPADELFARQWGYDRKDAAILLDWDRSKVPPNWALRYLHEELFSKYDHEVAVWNATDGNGSWTFGVPEQVVCGGSADWDRDEGQCYADLQALGLQLVGITHCHPGNGMPHHSGTDRTNFEKTGGLHPILSEDGRYVALHASVKGHLWRVDEYELPDDPVPEGHSVQFVYSGGRKLDDLLVKQSVVVVQSGYRPQQWQQQWQQQPQRQPMGFGQGIPLSEPDEREQRWLEEYHMGGRRGRKQRKRERKEQRKEQHLLMDIHRISIVRYTDNRLYVVRDEHINPQTMVRNWNLTMELGDLLLER